MVGVGKLLRALVLVAVVLVTVPAAWWLVWGGGHDILRAADAAGKLTAAKNRIAALEREKAAALQEVQMLQSENLELRKILRDRDGDLSALRNAGVNLLRHSRSGGQ